MQTSLKILPNTAMLQNPTKLPRPGPIPTIKNQVYVMPINICIDVFGITMVGVLQKLRAQLAHIHNGSLVRLSFIDQALFEETEISYPLYQELLAVFKQKKLRIHTLQMVQGRTQPPGVVIPTKGQGFLRKLINDLDPDFLNKDLQVLDLDFRLHNTGVQMDLLGKRLLASKRIFPKLETLRVCFDCDKLFGVSGVLKIMENRSSLKVLKVEINNLHHNQIGVIQQVFSLITKNPSLQEVHLSIREKSLLERRHRVLVNSLPFVLTWVGTKVSGPFPNLKRLNFELVLQDPVPDTTIQPLLEMVKTQCANLQSLIFKVGCHDYRNPDNATPNPLCSLNFNAHSFELSVNQDIYGVQADSCGLASYLQGWQSQQDGLGSKMLDVAKFGCSLIRGKKQSLPPKSKSIVDLLGHLKQLKQATSLRLKLDANWEIQEHVDCFDGILQYVTARCNETTDENKLTQKGNMPTRLEFMTTYPEVTSNIIQFLWTLSNHSGPLADLSLSFLGSAWLDTNDLEKFLLTIITPEGSQGLKNVALNFNFAASLPNPTELLSESRWQNLTKRLDSFKITWNACVMYQTTYFSPYAATLQLNSSDNNPHNDNDPINAGGRERTMVPSLLFSSLPHEEQILDVNERVAGYFVDTILQGRKLHQNVIFKIDDVFQLEDLVEVAELMGDKILTEKLTILNYKEAFLDDTSTRDQIKAMFGYLYHKMVNVTHLVYRVGWQDFPAQRYEYLQALTTDSVWDFISYCLSSPSIFPALELVEVDMGAFFPNLLSVAGFQRRFDELKKRDMVQKKKASRMKVIISKAKRPCSHIIINEEVLKKLCDISHQPSSSFIANPNSITLTNYQERF